MSNLGTCISDYWKKLSHEFILTNHLSNKLSNSVDRGLLVNLVTQLVKKFPPFMELGVSLPCSQDPATGPYPEPDTSSPQ
jgi:hypothetical protein